MTKLRLFTVLGLLLFAGLAGAHDQPAAAEPRVSYGWWSQGNALDGSTLPPQPDVPSDGMFVQNTPTGPLSVSAVKFDVPAGTTGDVLVLGIVGTPVISQPPVACLATGGFKPEQNGRWSSRPSYNCANPVFGTVDAEGTQVAFSVRSLVRESSLSLVIFAGGASDRIAMQAPEAASLLFSTNPASSHASERPATPVDEWANSFGATREPSRAAAPSTLDLHPAARPVTQPPAPAIADASDVTTGADAATPVAVRSNSIKRHNQIRTELGTKIGLALLLLVLIYWAEGFGAVPLRSWNAATSARDRPPG